MTASAERRRRFTIVGALLAFAGVVSVIVVSSVAVATLRSSREGRAPDVETRPVRTFPDTPNAVVGIVDDLDRLTSLAVLTLDPSGIGGSIVVVPVNADSTNGAGSERRPISRQPFPPGDEQREQTLASELEPLLSLTLERSAVLGPDELSDALESFGNFDAELSADVIDSDTAGSGVVADEGSSTLDVDEMVDALTAIDGDGPAYAHHATDVELWRAIAAGSPTDAEAPLDDDGRPIPPESFDELWERLFAGDVGVRDLAINTRSARVLDDETDADFVLIDGWDSLLVFGSISPGLVSTPNESLNLSLVVGFDPDDVAALGDAVDGTPITKESMTRRFIGELLFAQANVVAVDLSTTPIDVPARTQIVVADESMERGAVRLSERFFEDADVLVAEELIDGVDVVIVLGADFLELRAEQVEAERRAAEEAGDGDSDFDFSTTADTEVPDATDAPPDDTVASDG